METCPIFYGKDPIGEADVCARGLYYEIRCRCSLPEKGVFRIKVSREEGEADLGICVPEGDAFGIHTRLPMKKLGRGAWRFILEAESVGGRFVPIEMGKPFPCLSEIWKSRLVTENGIAGIRII